MRETVAVFLLSAMLCAQTPPNRRQFVACPMVRDTKAHLKRDTVCSPDCTVATMTGLGRSSSHCTNRPSTDSHDAKASKMPMLERLCKKYCSMFARSL